MNLEENTITSTLPPSIDKFLMDMSQMYIDDLSYTDISNFGDRATEEDIKQLRKYKKELSQGFEEDDPEVQEIFKSIKSIVKGLDEALHGKKEIDEFFKLCDEIGLKTFGDLQRFADDNKNRIIVNDLLSKYDSSMSTDAFFETLRDYKKEHLDNNEDFEYDDPLNIIKKLKRKDENMSSEKEIYYTLHQTNENGDSYTKENYITKDDVRKALNELIDTYTNYGSENVRGLLVTEGDDEKQIALYWSVDGMSWTKDFDLLNNEFDDGDLNESKIISEDTSHTIATLDEIISGFIDNMEDSQISKEIQFFKSIASKLGVKDYDKLYVIVDDGEYDPEFIFQDGLRLPNKEGKKVIHFPKINMIAEYINGVIYMYFVTEDDAKLYLQTANEYLNPIELDENKNEFAENKLDANKVDSSIKLKRIDDEFKW